MTGGESIITEIKRIGARNTADANLPNRPFTEWGRMIPALHGCVWTYTVEALPEATEVCFPDVPCDPAARDAAFFGAYRNGVCVGVAVLRSAMFRYLYLEDLKVDPAHRRTGIGAMLVEACMAHARAQGAQGVYTVGQDNNASACLFYLKCGFQIGGFNNRDYRGTPQAHKADIYFYRDCE